MTRLSRRWRWAVTAAAVLLILLGLYLARTQILTAAGAFLRVADDPVQADVIFVLAGESYARPTRAAELYLAGHAGRIVIPWPEDPPMVAAYPFPNMTLIAAWHMQRLGVAREDIVMLVPPEGSTSTIDDARMFREYARRHDVRRALVVTSEYHTRRTRWVMRRAFRGSGVELFMMPAADPRFTAADWWKSEVGVLAYVEEYLKWLHNATQW